MEHTKLKTGLRTVNNNGRIEVYNAKEWEQRKAKETANNISNAFMIVMIIGTVVMTLLGYADCKLN